MSKTNYNPYSVHSIPAFLGGMNTKMNPDEIQDFELADCENFDVTEASISTAPGFVLWDNKSLPGPYWGGFCFRKSTGYTVNIRQRQGKLEYSVDGTETWTQCTLPTSGSPASQISLSQVPCTFAALNDIVLWSNGSENVMSSADGVTWTSRSSLPKSKVLFENAKNRILFLAQTGTNSQYRFDWCDINDPLTINANSYELVDPNNYGYVIGAGRTPDGTTIVIKEAASYQVADVVDTGLVDINFIGACTITSHQSIATTNTGVIWLGKEGIYEYIGGQIRLISGRIARVGRNNVTKDYLACGAFFDSKYYLSMPDAEISQDYNSQEYVVHLMLARNDAVQPYSITRNRRYFGCYFVQDSVSNNSRVLRLFVGDSRPLSTTGSPAVYVNKVFGWVNNNYDENYTPGLGGEPQEAFFVTKYFTENVPYFNKKYKKFFSNLKTTQNIYITAFYRFVPYGPWTEKVISLSTGGYDFEEGFGFAEGFGLAALGQGTQYTDIENVEKPRGIQYKLYVYTSANVTFLDFAYSYILKPKFKQ